MIASVSSVTAPLRARTRPSTVAPVVTVMLVSARMVAAEGRPGAERRGAADLPEDVARACAVDQGDLAGRGGGERRAGLEDEDGIGIALAVERQRAGQTDGRRRIGRHRAPGYARRGRRRSCEVGGLRRCRVVGRTRSALRVLRHRVPAWFTPVSGQRREPGDRGGRERTDVSVQLVGASVRHTRAGDDARSWRLRRAGSAGSCDGRGHGGRRHRRHRDGWHERRPAWSRSGGSDGRRLDGNGENGRLDRCPDRGRGDRRCLDRRCVATGLVATGFLVTGFVTAGVVFGGAATRPPVAGSLGAGCAGVVGAMGAVAGGDPRREVRCRCRARRRRGRARGGGVQGSRRMGGHRPTAAGQRGAPAGDGVDTAVCARSAPLGAAARTCSDPDPAVTCCATTTLPPTTAITAAVTKSRRRRLRRGVSRRSCRACSRCGRPPGRVRSWGPPRGARASGRQPIGACRGSARGCRRAARAAAGTRAIAIPPPG